VTEPPLSLSERLYAALLRWYPDDFRRDFAPDMRDLFRDHLRAARARSGVWGVALLWMRAIPDLLLTGFHIHEDNMLQAILQDARYAMRILKKNALFTAIAIAVVALGTGAVSTIYSVANAMIFRPIPGVARQSEVLGIRRTRQDKGLSRSVSYPYYRYLAEHSKTMAGIASWDMIPTTLSAGGAGIIGQSNLVTGNYFDVLGARPAVGRFFTPDEGRIGSPASVVVISHDLWQRMFAGDSSVVGRPLIVNGQHATVIGVAPPHFRGLFPVLRVDTWVPMPMQPLVRRGGDLLTSPGNGWLDLFGRIKPGVSEDVARAELSALTKQFAKDVEAGRYSDQATFTEVHTRTITGLPGDTIDSVVAFFVVLLAVSGLVLLIASVNVASMLLARAVARRREIAVRIALGAARARLVRQLLTESLILFGAGGVLGVGLAFLATRALSGLPLPVDVPIAIDASPDARAIIVTLAVALVTGIVFGLAPALQGSRDDVATTLRGDTSGSGRSRSRLRNALVIAQVAASLLLLTASGLFLRALSNGERVDPGYDISHVTTASFDVGLAGYDTARQRQFYAALDERIRHLPNVTAVGYTRLLPLSLNSSCYDVAIPGAPKSVHSACGTLVAGDYFDVMRQPIIAGRALLRTDNESAPNVAVVSQRFAERAFPGVSAIGRTFRLDSASTVTIVGIARDVKFSRLDEKLEPFMYLPAAQHWRSDMNLVVRTTGDPSQLIPAIRAETRAMDALLAPPVTVTLERAAAVALLPQRFAVIITASLGAAGLLLAAIGLYGVLAFSVAQRTREIGVRMALGAAKEQVLRMVIGEGLRVVAIGVGIGLVLAAVATRALTPFLFGVSPLDATAFLSGVAALGVVGLIASWMPARRAAGADPMMALRQD
jgi:predicted permease